MEGELKVAVFTSYGRTLATIRGRLFRDMIAAGHEVLVSAPDCNPSTTEELSGMGVVLRPLPLVRRGLNPVADLVYLVRLMRLLRLEKVDLCFFYTIKPVILGSLAAKLCGVPKSYALITGLGYTFANDTIFGRAFRMVAGGLYRMALRKSDWIFFQNSDDRDLFLGLRIITAGKSSVVNGSGVDLEFFSPLPIPDGPPRFLMIGRLLKAKGITEFLAAAAILKKRFPDSEFRLIGHAESGPGAVDAKLVAQAAARNLVDYSGEVPDVRKEIYDSAVFVLPSYREGVPRSALEAMACGRPIVTTDAPGCRETVLNGVNGYRVPVGDVQALVKAMESFIQRESLATTMGRASRTIAERKFDVQLVNKVMLNQMGLLGSDSPGKN